MPVARTHLTAANSPDYEHRINTQLFNWEFGSLLGFPLSLSFYLQTIPPQPLSANATEAHHLPELAIKVP